MNPLDFLTITSKKLKDQSSEADLRTSAGRSYYAVYHMIRNLIESESVEVTDKHSVVWNSFYQNGVPPEARAIGKDMQSLYDLRRAADYELDGEWRSAKAKTAYDLACHVKDEFVKMFAGSTKDRILDGFRASQRHRAS